MSNVLERDTTLHFEYHSCDCLVYMRCNMLFEDRERLCQLIDYHQLLSAKCQWFQQDSFTGISGMEPRLVII